VPIAVIGGKPLGILIAAGPPSPRPAPAAPGWLARADCRRIHRRNRVQHRGCFFCAALLPAGQLRSETGMGVLLSLAGAPMAI